MGFRGLVCVAIAVVLGAGLLTALRIRAGVGDIHVEGGPGESVAC